MTWIRQTVAVPAASAGSGGLAPLGVDLRHLRYFVAVADAGTFTHAAERMFIAQPTLSQQIRRLEEMIGTPLLQRRREGLRLTEAGAVLLEESRTVLSLVDHGVSRTRQVAGLARPRLPFVLPPYLPEALAVEVTARLRRTAADADLDVVRLETPLDAEFSPICQRRADAGLGWITTASESLPPPSMSSASENSNPPPGYPPHTRRRLAGGIGLDELAGMDVVHGPRRVSPGTYDAWLAVLRTRNPQFAFTDPSFRQSLPMTLAFAATASRPTAVLTGPQHRSRDWPGSAEPDAAAEPAGMVRACVEECPLAATAALAWSGDLPRDLQQVLFDAADSIAF